MRAIEPKIRGRVGITALVNTIFRGVADGFMSISLYNVPSYLIIGIGRATGVTAHFFAEW